MRGVAIAIVVCCCTVTAEARPRYRLRIGDALPDVELRRVSGAGLRLGTLRGRPLVVSFFSRYCDPCRRELPVLERVLARVNRGLPPARQVASLIISVDSAADARRAAAATPSLRWLHDVDGKAREQFDPRTFPTTFLADAGGRVRHINRGFGSGYEARVERWLSGLVAAAPTPR